MQDETIYPHINRAASATTIYPPVAQMLFFSITRVSGTLTGMRLAMAAFEGLAIAILLHLLPIVGLPRERVLIFAWNPVAVWEIAGNGHIDGAAIGFIAVAFLAFAHRRPTLVGLALGGATLIKLLPICLLPALWRRWDWRMPLAFGAIVVLAYLPYLGVGSGVLGYLPGYAREEGLDSGGGYYPLFLLAQAVPLPSFAGIAYLVAGTLILAALALSIAFRNRKDPPGPELLRSSRDCLLLSTALIILLTPNHPWYFVWLLLFACFAPSAAVICISVLSFLLYFSYYDPGKIGQAIMYGIFWTMLLVELGRRYLGIRVPVLVERKG